ncbi:MAG TPA: NADH-quinone oxidoreductase subunit N [Opitutaceae bacterium]|nr:NADH-quinone oxidoreductase subunit N [Opitutaceae bacterium]
MSVDTLQQISASNEWLAIFPEMFLGIAALALLGLEILLPKSQHRHIPLAASMALGAMAVGVAINFDTAWMDSTTFAGLLRHSLPGQVARLFFLVSGLLVCFVAGICLPRTRMPRVEFYHLVLVVTAAMMLLAQSNNFVMMFVALETVTIGFYILVSYFRDNPLTLEAGLKYLVSGALSSGILLFGIVLIYGAVGRVVDGGGFVRTGFEFEVVAHFLRSNPDNFLVLAGMLLVLGGVAFKIGAVPFQVWIPDVYQGAPTPVTAFLAVSSKAAGFAILLMLVLNVFPSAQDVLVPVLSAMAAATILFGNLAAIYQRNAKRLMGLSGVSHAGYLLMGVAAALTVPWAQGAVWFYLFSYLLASMAVFGVMAHVAGPDDTDQQIDHYGRLAREQPLLAAVLAVAVGSLAGIPPLVGFLGKLLIFIAAFQAHLFWLLAVAVVGVVISIYYYFGWIRAAFFEVWSPAGSVPAPVGPARTVPAAVSAVVLVGLALASVVLGFFQEPLTAWLMIR